MLCIRLCEGGLRILRIEEKIEGRLVKLGHLAPDALNRQDSNQHGMCRDSEIGPTHVS